MASSRAGKTPSLLERIGGIRSALFVIGAGLVGVLAGIVIYTFVYANGFAYFTEDPTACIQCHSMNKQYAAWTKGSHHAEACQECHSPKGNTAKWLLSEADNGFWHSLKFTTGWYPQNIKIREVNRQIVQTNCTRCHGALVQQIEQPAVHANQQIDCLRCHAEVGHKR